MKKLFFLFILLVFIAACSKDDDTPKNPEPTPPVSEEGLPVRAVDISAFPEINAAGTIFYNAAGQKEDFLHILKASGINTVRLRLWVDPTQGHSGFEEVKLFSQTLRNKGFALWLTLHYSNSWADPGNQTKPEAWKDLSFDALKKQVHDYTVMISEEIKPEYIQIGNEINSGILFPEGNISKNPNQFLELVAAGVTAVRETNPDSKIIVHFAGLDNADWFFGQVAGIDYDIIGLSYYPIWHGKDLDQLENRINSLASKYNRQVVIAETAYPFTLDYNDWTNNIVGLNEHLIAGYAASAQGQKEYLETIIQMLKESDAAIGFSYWGTELVAWNGAESTQGSPWENQALFDFNNKALPALEVFNLQ